MMQTKTALETIIRMAEAGEFGIADFARKALAGMEGYVLMPVEPTHEILHAMAGSRAQCDEYAFEPMCDLLGFSGENKTHMVLEAAYVAMIKSDPFAGIDCAGVDMMPCQNGSEV